MSFKKYILFSVFMSFSCGIAAKENFPSFITPCKKGKNINKCMLDNINMCKPYLKGGIPKLFIPPLDPLILPKISMKNPGVSIILKNFSLYKLNDFEIKDINFDIEKNNLHLETLFNHVHCESMYELSGKLLMFDLNSSGNSRANITKLLTVLDMNLGRETKGGKEHLIIKDTKIKQLPPEGFELNLDNLFGKNEELTRQTMSVLNENSLALFQETHEVMDATMTSFIDFSLKKLFDKYSIDELFSD